MLTYPLTSIICIQKLYIMVLIAKSHRYIESLIRHNCLHSHMGNHHKPTHSVCTILRDIDIHRQCIRLKSSVK